MVLRQIPHPSGKKGQNVGVLLSKDFVKALESGLLSSDYPEAEEALQIARETSYWTSVRKRVFDRIFREVKNPYGENANITLPDILPHGTVTRRTVENLMVTMCSAKNYKIGSELKTRIQAPDGWKVVGADFDSQELSIAGIYADSWEGGINGCTALGFQVLSGSKAKGSDGHTVFARNMMEEEYKDLYFDPELGILEKVTIDE